MTTALLIPLEAVDALAKILLGDETLQESFTTFLVFLIIGFGISWRNNSRVPLIFLGQFLLAMTAARYSVSYLTYHEALREGLSPIFWTCAALLGVVLAQKRGK